MDLCAVRLMDQRVSRLVAKNEAVPRELQQVRQIGGQALHFGLLKLESLRNFGSRHGRRQSGKSAEERSSSVRPGAFFVGQLRRALDPLLDERVELDLALAFGFAGKRSIRLDQIRDNAGIAVRSPSYRFDLSGRSLRPPRQNERLRFRGCESFQLVRAALGTANSQFAAFCARRCDDRQTLDGRKMR